MSKKLALHPLCQMFPKMPDMEIADLARNIKEQGQRENIVLFGGKVLDGRGRMLACEIAKVKPKTEKFKGNEKAALEFVVSKNLHRRHLNESQRAMLAAEISTLRKNGNGSIDPSTEKAAKMLNVSTGSVKRAKVVAKKGTKALKNMVKSGKVSVHAAATVSKLSKSNQRKLTAKGSKAVKAEAAKRRGGLDGNYGDGKVNTDAYTSGKSESVAALDKATEKTAMDAAAKKAAVARIEFAYERDKAWYNMEGRSIRAIVDRIIGVIEA